MSYQVLARKWRPKTFQEVIGQAHITRALQNAIINKKIGHAYMLVGTRGVGKTSVARLFAKAIRCEQLSADGNSCGNCAACLDFDTETSMNVIEIDGASNNSVDNIRELISNVHYLPTLGKYKVYVIDEVHMLSTNAFNALLKTLEEPPAHVVFIFATTEAQKLLGTVLSRCQRFDFRNISVTDLVAHIKEIARVEGINFQNDQLIAQIALLGRGSARDTLSLLDQVLTSSQNNMITEENLTLSLGVAGPSIIKNIIASLYEGKTQELSKDYNKLLSENVPVKNIASSLLDELFLDLKVKKDLSQAELIWIYETIAKETSWIFNSIAPEKAFEVLLYKAALRRSFFTNKIASPTSVEKSEKIITDVKTIDKTWEGFLTFLNAKSPASASNLEQGNIISPLRLDNGELSVELGFGYSGFVFFEYLSDIEVHQKVVNNLSEYFGIDQSKIHLNLKQLESHEKFVSTAEIKDQLAEISLQEKVDNFKNNPMLKEAEKMFNAKVDKVIIENKK